MGTTNRKTAEARKQRLEENLALVKNGRLTLPDDGDLGKFLLSDGKLDGKPQAKTKLQTLRQFKDAFCQSIPEGALEANTLSLTETHFRHLFRVLGKSFRLRSLTLGELQSYVDQRSKDNGVRGKKLSPVTIKKEITSLRSLWNWAVGFVTQKLRRTQIRAKASIAQEQRWDSSMYLAYTVRS